MAFFEVLSLQIYSREDFKLSMYCGHIGNKLCSNQNVFFHFRNEVMNTMKDGSYSGILQVWGMANALETPISSVYPTYGGATVREDLHTEFNPPTVCKLHNGSFLLRNVNLAVMATWRK